ncbi:MAG: Alcohol dehydrogenase zinc-binding domain protein [Pseudonocardia sp.]|jgi:NADPH2:quinone reductase|uniref:NADPH:quinone oxidoreductase family protein n=1 Tax=Pseudonocardia sp. TaxID=60912 RepID=UPI002606DC62|nr:NADPH:quinone oxidoreductase family protein [Pseudonocardia sp.]MCU1627582.1 Alcohol dehydrogenase zinc-binding domain protein [Pseudonocardia sp.]MDT7701681.1 NADPH:quinone reductase [Pseudonocardiales bacterium]HEV7472280.1 NADPH:quinone oxidoreductase family protein [Pseudonocardia sp.]
MQRVVCRAFGDVEDLEVVEEAAPAPGPGEVLVEVDAAGVSFVDGLIVRGLYQVRPPLPFTPGSTVGGRVVALGEGVSAPAVGTAVAGLATAFGGFTSHSVLPASTAVPLPDGVSAETAVTAIESYSTLVFAVTHRVAIGEGEWVVVLGAGGGIGLAAVDVVRSLGGRVVAVASSEDKRQAALAAGAETAIDYTDLKDGIRAATDGGADVVIDPVGGPAAESALRALGTGGRFCVLGFASGEIPRLPANIVLLRNRSVVGVDWGDWARTDGDAATELVADVLGRIARGELHPPRPQVFRLVEAGKALRLFADRAVTGKIALAP